MPRVTHLEGASTSTVTPVDCMHTYASALAYVGTSVLKGRNPWRMPIGICVRRVENTQGFSMMNADYLYWI